MTQEPLPIFATTLQKTYEILKAIEEQFGWTDRHRAYSALRSVLHTLRDRLPVEQAISLGAQLPMLVRGFYYEGWQPKVVPLKMKKDEFIGEVERLSNLPFQEDTKTIIKGVLHIIENFVDPAEIAKIKKTLPKDIVSIMNE